MGTIHKNRIVSGLFFAAFVLAFSWRAEAAPSFARKYRVSCQTCHTAFPNLNAFGQGFKRNGYMFPNEEEAEAVVQEKPIAMGTEEDKEKWPKEAVWPGTLPGSTPLSVMLTGTFRSRPRNAAQNANFSFDGLEGNVGLIAAGVLGKHFPFWGRAGFARAVATNATDNTTTSTSDVDVERVFIGVKPWTRPYFIAKVGRFDPAVLPVSNHRSLLGGYYLTDGRQVGTNQWNLEEAQSGIEFSGVFLNDKIFYSLGVVEGSTGGTTTLAGATVGNQTNNEKDVYGRMEYKLIGSLWGGDSLALGTFAYQGFARLVSATTNQRDRFTLFGADVTANFKNIYAVGTYARQENSRPVLGATASRSTNHVLTEVLWVPVPWFIPGGRYEFFDSGTTEDQRITTALNFLVAPNIKTFVRVTLDKPDGTDFQDAPDILVGLLGGF